jgi:hypothetical protein
VVEDLASTTRRSNDDDGNVKAVFRRAVPSRCRPWFASFLLVLCASGCRIYEWRCENDEDCRGAKTMRDREPVEYCLFGHCQQCAADKHCTAGRCSRGRCVAEVGDAGPAGSTTTPAK